MGILFIWRRVALQNFSMVGYRWTEKGSITARKKTRIPQSVWVHLRIIWIPLFICERNQSPKQDQSLKYPATLPLSLRSNRQTLRFNPTQMLKGCWLTSSRLLLSQRCSNQLEQARATSMITIRMPRLRNPNNVIIIIIIERISRSSLEAS